MRVDIIETLDLGDRSYVVSDGMSLPASPPVTRPAATGPRVALDLDDDLPRQAAAGVPDAEGPSGAGRLPVVPLAGVVASGAFAFWASLTCFVC